MKFCDKLIYTRAVLKMTQSELAKEMGVSIITIHRWESEKSKPSKREEMIFNIFIKEKNITFSGGFENEKIQDN